MYFWLGLSVFAALMVGCGGLDESRVVRVWHMKAQSERALLEEIVREYNALHKDRRVVVLNKPVEELRNHFLAAAVAGVGPDLVYVASDNVGVFELTGVIMPLDEVLGADFFEEFHEKGKVSWKGRQWMVADKVGDHLMLIYNRDLISEPPRDFDEFVKVLKEVTRDGEEMGQKRYGITWNYQEPFFFIPFLTAFGGWLMDESGRPTLDTPQMVEALRFVSELRNVHRVVPPETDYQISDALFKEGRAAMIINGPWSWADYQVPKRSMIAPLPYNSEKGFWAEPLVSACGYCVNVNVKREKLPLVLEVLKYLTSEETQRRMVERLLSFPTRLSVIESGLVQGNPILQKSWEQILRGRPMPIAPVLRQIWDGMRGAYQLIMAGKLSPEEGARRMQADTEKLIRDSQM
ncbi:MAG: extracellular solute-binding protein [Methylacidiphilales bacterium]|nr:extracellular solute-binding protein [Candidatus Methylacidiphilales bacterium]MDW8349242.1 extracellular solute-binding protein [Verrucomicrobiae bacterium]